MWPVVLARAYLKECYASPVSQVCSYHMIIEPWRLKEWERYAKMEYSWTYIYIYIYIEEELAQCRRSLPTLLASRSTPKMECRILPSQIEALSLSRDWQYILLMIA